MKREYLQHLLSNLDNDPVFPSGKEVFIIQSGSKRVNNDVFELLTMVYACKTSCARKIVGSYFVHENSLFLFHYFSVNMIFGGFLLRHNDCSIAFSLKALRESILKRIFLNPLSILKPVGCC